DPQRAPPRRDDDRLRRHRRPRAPGRPAVSPEFGYSVTPGPAGGVAKESAAAEGMGYDRIGIWDSPALFREPWVTLAAVATATRRAAIGPWVTNPLSRH